MKLLLALVVLGLLGIAVIACGSSSSSEKAASAARASSTASTPTPTASTPTHPPDTTSTAAVSPVEATVRARPPTLSQREKYDRDDDDNTHVPDDNNPSPAGFVTAAPADAATAAALVKRYYAAAVKENGASGCSMFTAHFAKAVPLDYGKLGPPYLRRAAGTCAAVMALFFKHEHRQLVRELPKMRVVRVSVHGEQVDAFLSFGRLYERYIALLREGHTWKVASLLDGELE